MEGGDFRCGFVDVVLFVVVGLAGVVFVLVAGVALAALYG